MTRTGIGLTFALILLGFGSTDASAQVTEEVFDVTIDGIGSIRMLTNANQDQVERRDFMPFGQEWTQNPPPSSVTPVKFGGKEHDTETGFDYFGARYDRPNSGRFTSVDPFVNWNENLVDPQRWNRYVYVRNSPLKFTDPDGRDPQLVTAGIGAAVYAAWNAYVNVQQGQPWHQNIGFEASKGFLVGLTFGLAAPALAGAEVSAGAAVGSATLSASAQLGAAREIAVARLVGGRLAGEPGIGMSVTVKGLGTTGVDVLGAAGEYIGVGGPAKGLNPADFGRKLQILKAAAEQAGVTAKYAFQKGTPRWVIDFARKRLGEDNDFEYHLR